MSEQILFAKQMLTAAGWQQDAHAIIDAGGHLRALGAGAPAGARRCDILLPAPANVHSHSFQRAMAGRAESRGRCGEDDFWSWRRLMYEFLEHLDAADVEAIAAQVQLEMLEAGYASVGEFHYVHHRQGGQAYDEPAELGHRLLRAAQTSGIGYTHLPVLYMRGGLDDRPLTGGQLRFGCTLDRFASIYEGTRAALRDCPHDYRLGVAPHSLRSVDRNGIAFATELADGGPIHIHIAEQVAEVEAVRKSLRATPVRWLLDHAPVDKRWCLIHATHTDEAERRDLAASDAVAGLCPMTEANLGDGIFDALAFANLGGRMAIGSDSNVRIALAEELRLLEYTQRLQRRRRVLLTGNELSCGRFLYEQAARGGAQALARNAGRIETGALADLVALDGDNAALRNRQGDELLDGWIFAGDDSVVTDVWSAGRHVVQHGQHVSREAITARFDTVMDRLRTMA